MRLALCKYICFLEVIFRYLILFCVFVVGGVKVEDHTLFFDPVVVFFGCFGLVLVACPLLLALFSKEIGSISTAGICRLRLQTTLPPPFYLSPVGSFPPRRLRLCSSWDTTLKFSQRQFLSVLYFFRIFNHKLGFSFRFRFLGPHLPRSLTKGMPNFDAKAIRSM